MARLLNFARHLGLFLLGSTLKTPAGPVCCHGNAWLVSPVTGLWESISPPWTSLRVQAMSAWRWKWSVTRQFCLISGWMCTAPFGPILEGHLDNWSKWTNSLHLTQNCSIWTHSVFNYQVKLKCTLLLPLLVAEGQVPQCLIGSQKPLWANHCEKIWN